MSSDDKSQDLFGYDESIFEDLDKVDIEESSNRWPETMNHIYHILKSELVARGVDERIALVQLRRLCKETGGMNYYFPTGETLEAELRDYALWQDYTGRNSEEVARKYKLTRSRVYQIVAIMRKREKRRNQMPLF